MAWTYEQNFNTLNDGDLNGQDSWSGDTAFDVVTTGTPSEGAKHVSSILESDSEVTIARAVTAVTAGIVYVSIKVNRTAGTRRGNIYLKEGAATLVRCFFVYDGTNNWIKVYDNLTLTTVQDPISNDTYYRVGIEWDNVGQPGKFRANVNGGAFGSWLNWFNGGAMSAGIDSIVLSDLGNNGSGTGTLYFDTISPNYTISSGPANLKSYNTNLKANIKSINTNVIANVKSLNTNI